MNWAENDTLFKSELEGGREWELMVAVKLLSEGITVKTPQKTFRRNIDEAYLYADEADILVCPQRYKLECKSRRLDFNGSQDFPYPSIMVTTVRSWETAAKKPVAIVCVSRTTGGLIIIPRSSEGQWYVEQAYDSVRKIYDDFYFAPLSAAKSWNWLVARLKEQE